MTGPDCPLALEPGPCSQAVTTRIGSVGPVTTAADTTGANGVGIATLTADGTVLDTWFPAPALSTADQGETGTQRIGVLELEGLLGPDWSGLCAATRPAACR